MNKKIPCRQGTAADIIKSLGITEEELERAKKYIEIATKEIRKHNGKEIR